MPQVGIEDILGSGWNTDSISCGIMNEACERTRSDLEKYLAEEVSYAYVNACASALEKLHFETFKTRYEQLSDTERKQIPDAFNGFIEPISDIALEWVKANYPEIGF